jgi:hypothetical protein
MRESIIANLAKSVVGPAKEPATIVTKIFTFLKSHKKQSNALLWLLPNQAAYLPFLDCKGFVILFKALLSFYNIDSEIWLGYEEKDRLKAHCWLVVNNSTTKWICDQNLNQPLSVGDYVRSTPWQWRHKIE